MTYKSGTSFDAARQHSIVAVCEALGVPERDWHLFTRWAAAPMTTESLDTLYQYVDVMIAERCTHPADDLMSTLIDVEVDGEAMTVDDIRSFVATLVTGAA